VQAGECRQVTSNGLSADKVWGCCGVGTRHSASSTYHLVNHHGRLLWRYQPIDYAVLDGIRRPHVQRPLHVLQQRKTPRMRANRGQTFQLLPFRSCSAYGLNLSIPRLHGHRRSCMCDGLRPSDVRAWRQTLKQLSTGAAAKASYLVQLRGGVAGGLRQDLQHRVLLCQHLLPLDGDLHRLPLPRGRYPRLVQHSCVHCMGLSHCPLPHRLGFDPHSLAHCWVHEGAAATALHKAEQALPSRSLFITKLLCIGLRLQMEYLSHAAA
jgi:hypothetical protein